MQTDNDIHVTTIRSGYKGYVSKERSPLLLQMKNRSALSLYRSTCMYVFNRNSKQYQFLINKDIVNIIYMTQKSKEQFQQNLINKRN